MTYEKIDFKRFENRADVTIGEILDTIEDGEFKDALLSTYINLSSVMSVNEMMILSIILEDLTGEELESPLQLVEYLVRAFDDEELVKLNLAAKHILISL